METREEMQVEIQNDNWLATKVESWDEMMHLDEVVEPAEVPGQQIHLAEMLQPLVVREDVDVMPMKDLFRRQIHLAEMLLPLVVRVDVDVMPMKDLLAARVPGAL
jgi:hypothetical protein